MPKNAKTVIDTSVLIDYRRGHPDAVVYLPGLMNKSAAVIHPVCAAELLVGARDQRDLTHVITFLSTFKKLRVKPIDFDRCLSLSSQLRLAHGIGWPDCLIAATCIRLGQPLATTNDRHFKSIRGLQVVRPY